jgi:hypothetical protein
MVSIVITHPLSLKKKGSIETATVLVPLVPSRRRVAKSAFLWYVTPLGKCVASGELFVEKIP